MLRQAIRALLIEGRVDDVKKKYGSGIRDGLSDEQIQKLSANDPSGNNKYLMWMARETLELRHDTNLRTRRTPEDVIQYIQDFHKNLQRLKKKDIMAYDEAEDVRDAVAALGASKTQQRKETKLEGAKKLYEDDDFLLLLPRNKEAVCMYGAETQWCITMKNMPHYEDYIEEGKIFYFLINKSGKGNKEGQKIAFVYTHEGLGEVWDAENNNIDNEDGILSYMVQAYLHPLDGEEDHKEKEAQARDLLRRFINIMDKDSLRLRSVW